MKQQQTRSVSKPIAISCNAPPSSSTTEERPRASSPHQQWLESSIIKKSIGSPTVDIQDKEEFAKSSPCQEDLSEVKSKRRESLVPSNQGTKKSVGPDSFNLLAVIGVGAYGRVFQVEEKQSNKIYAMKVLQKGHILKKKNLRYVHEEKNILTRVDYPFVVSLMCAFQTENKLYLVMEYLSGGELFHHLRNEGLFMEDTASFYTAEIVCALEYLHSCKIIHRDLKPENVLLDSEGHVRVTDFGLATVNSDEKQAKTICGTDLYMAPEMLGGNGYGLAVDWWSLGTLLFEMLTGDPPFFARDTRKLYKKIMSEKPKYPRWLSSPCHSILKGLLTRNVDQRLGAAKSTMFKTRGVQEVKLHAFFKGLDWAKLEKKEIVAPFCPEHTKEGNLDTSNFDDKFTKMVPRFSDDVNAKYNAKHLEDAKEDDFLGFSYVRESFLEMSMKLPAVDKIGIEESTKKQVEVEAPAEKEIKPENDLTTNTDQHADASPSPTPKVSHTKEPIHQPAVEQPKMATSSPNTVVWPSLASSPQGQEAPRKAPAPVLNYKNIIEASKAGLNVDAPAWTPNNR